MTQPPSHAKLRSVFDVAAHAPSLTGPLQRIFAVTCAPARCTVGPQLAAKYKVAADNQQTVVSITNRWTWEQTWFNQARTTKPQTFAASSSAASALDPTGNGATCDFCAWPQLTATDPGFGRIQLPHAVTGSNLFKYAEPAHGVVLFKHHDPLAFSQAALSDLLDAAWLWMVESQRQHPAAHHPFLLWNCLPRAGASQYHGHAQAMLSSAPVPRVAQLQAAASSYQQAHPGCCYYADLLAAHAAVGLARQLSIPATAAAAAAAPGSAAASRTSTASSSSTGQQQQQQPQQQQHVAWGFASLTPVKDMETVVFGSHLCCPAFQRLLHAALRALIDGLGCATFNVGVLNLELSAGPPAGVGLARLHWHSQPHAAAAAAGTGGAGGDCALHEARGAAGDPTAATQSSSSSSRRSSSGSSSSGGSATASDGAASTCSSSGADSDGLWLPGPQYWARRAPVIARIVSRGKLSTAASDFGGLEVFGGASIGHTDPFQVVRQLEAQLAAGAGVRGDGSGRVAAAAGAASLPN